MLWAYVHGLHLDCESPKGDPTFSLLVWTLEVFREKTQADTALAYQYGPTRISLCAPAQHRDHVQ